MLTRLTVLVTFLMLLSMSTRAQTVAGQRANIGPDQFYVDVGGNTDIRGYVEVPGWVSELTGWKITAAGGADFRTIYVDELHAKSFIADLEQALAGGQIISKSVAVLSNTFTCPNAAGTATLTVDDLPGASGMQVFQTNDWVALRSFSRSGGGLTIGDCVGQVTSPVTPGGTQSWTFTRGSGGNAGSVTGGTVIPLKALALDYGTSGNGYYEVNAIDGTYGVNSPYAQVVTWTTAPVTANRVLQARYGNLLGVTGNSGEYGLVAGTPGGAGNAYVIASNLGVKIFGADLTLYNGSTPTVFLNHSVPSFALGASLPAGYGTGAGIWMGNDSGTYKFRAGTPGGAGLFWDGSTLTVNGNGGNAKNEIWNADCTASTESWAVATTSGLTVTLGTSLGSAWELDGASGGCYHFPSGTPANTTYTQAYLGSRYIPVLAGSTYEASTYIAQQQATSTTMAIQFLNSSLAQTGVYTGNACTTAPGGGSQLSQYCRTGVIAVAPAASIYARPVITTTYPGGLANPYVFWVHTFFAEGTAYQTQLSPWGPPGKTSISGGLIETQTIVANNILSGTITATQIAAGTITATQIAAGTITATQIAASTIDASRLNVTTLSAITGNLGTVTAGHLNGGDINLGGGVFVVNSSGSLTSGISIPAGQQISDFGTLSVAQGAQITGSYGGGGSLSIGTFIGGGAHQTVCANNGGYLFAVASGVAC